MRILFPRTTCARILALVFLSAAGWLPSAAWLPFAGAADPDTLLSLRPPSGCTVPELPDTAYVSPGNRRRLLPILFDNAGEGPLAPKSVRMGAQSRAPGYAWFDGVVNWDFAAAQYAAIASGGRYRYPLGATNGNTVGATARVG